MRWVNDVRRYGGFVKYTRDLLCNIILVKLLTVHWNEYKKVDRKETWIHSCIFFLIIAAFMMLTDGIAVIFFIPCVLVIVSLMYWFIRTCCDMTQQKAGYFCIRAFMLGEFAASLEWQLFYYGLNNWDLPLNMFVKLSFLILTHLVVFGIMYLLERKYREDNAKLQINSKEFFSAAFLCAIVYITSNLSYAFKNTPFSSQFTAEIFIIRTMVDLGGLGILFAYHMQLQDMNVKMEMEFLQNMLRMQYSNYQISEESITLVNQKYHDMKHQIAFLRSELESDEKLAYLDQMEQEIKFYETQNKTGNKVLDTILAAKSLQCQNQGISLTCVADGEELNFMNPIDLSALFGNALDNAMESVKKTNDPDKRLIHVSVSKQKSFLRIRVENYYEGEILFENGIPVTTKGNERYHGFGIKSIQGTVDKYNGSMTICTDGGWFELRILFPLFQSTP